MFAESHRHEVFSVICGSELEDLTTLTTSTTCILTIGTIKATKIYNSTTGGNDWKIFHWLTEASTSFAFPKAFTRNNANGLPISGLIYIYIIITVT